jgi:carboxypeptidase Taq
MPHSYAKLCNFNQKIHNLQNLCGIIHWDMSTNMPTGSAKARGDELAALQSIIHKFLTSDQFGDLIAAVSESRLNEWQKANLRETKRMRDNALAVETRLLEVLTKTSTECEMMWRDARKRNDFKSLNQIFRKVISIVKDIAHARGSYFGLSPYDALLDQYDHGRRSANIDPIFKELTKFLPDLVNNIIEKQKSKNISPLPTTKFPVAKQEELARFCMEKLGFNFNKGRLDKSTHPFCGGNSQDVRITNRYDENDFTSGLMGVLHESGHALYEQNLPEDNIDQPVGRNLGMTIHESQSLFVEMQLSRSKEFYEFIQPILLNYFDLDKNTWSVENLYPNRNKVEKSMIRVDADEATYPLHIILRYNIEKELLSGNLQVKDLPDVWNNGMKSLLGIKPANDREGCLQDIHWYMGAFGYFPTYTLGAICASQFFAAASHDLGNIKSLIKQGDFKPIVAWANKNIHSKGSFYSADDLLKNVTGKEIDVHSFKKHLETRYL